jgi:hypothetical protein
MKKTLAILALALFLGGLSVPAIAASDNALTMISLQEDDPKKKEKKAEKSKKAAEKKSSDCTTEKKSSDCSKKCEGDS